MQLLTSLLSLGLCSLCFIAIGVGILFFNKDNIGGDCRKSPEDRKEGCLSKEIGICPLDDSENYLKLATKATRLRKHRL